MNVGLLIGSPKILWTDLDDIIECIAVGTIIKPHIARGH